MIQHTTQEQWSRKDTQGKACRKEQRASKPSPGMPSSQSVNVFTTWTLHTRLIRIVLVVSFGSHDWLNYWPLVINSLSSSLSPPLRWGGGAESSSPLIRQSVSLAKSSHPSWILKNHFININLFLVGRGLLWITKYTTSTFIALRAISGTGDKN